MQSSSDKKRSCFQTVEKARASAIFSDEEAPFAYSPKGSPGGKRCKETLLRKASDLTAHVAEVGMKVGGLRPSDTSQKVYRKAEKQLRKTELRPLRNAMFSREDMHSSTGSCYRFSQRSCTPR